MLKSYCYTPGVGVRMQNVRENVKVMKFQSLCIFTCILTLLIIQNKAAYNNSSQQACIRWLLHLWFWYVLIGKILLATTPLYHGQQLCKVISPSKLPVKGYGQETNFYMCELWHWAWQYDHEWKSNIIQIKHDSKRVIGLTQILAMCVLWP